MLRNPYILFLDEPLSGLSYSDSRRFFSMLKEEAYKGKLIFITSPLPTAELFNMFDRIWLIDQDGYMIYTGEPSGSFSHFRGTGLLPYYYIQTGTGQVNPEDVIKIVETKRIHSDGTVSEERLVSPGAWYDAWRAAGQENAPAGRQSDKPVPINPSRLPGIEKQFMVYLLRNFRIRFSNMRYVLTTFLGISLTGGLIAAAIRMNYGNEYVFAANEYLPLYIFLSVNFALFGGLLTGAGEIFGERKRVARDYSLNLSYFSFQNSKVAFLMIVSAIQTLLFALAGNTILGINDMLLPYAVTYFSLAVLGNLTTLALSSGVWRIKALYILIPFLILPCLLFSGYLIRIDNSKNTAGAGNIPAISGFIPTRWAYEALMVSQYAENPYNRYFFPDEKKLYQSRYILNEILPSIEGKLYDCETFRKNNSPADSLEACLADISSEIRLLGERDEIAPFEKQNLLHAPAYDSTIYADVYGYITYVRFLMENTIPELTGKLDMTMQHLADSLENISVDKFRDRNQNRYVEEFVRGGTEENVSGTEEGLMKKRSPVFIPPESDYGKARFFASRKRFNGQYIPVFRFNLSMIWLLCLVMYIIFLTDAVKHLVNLFRTAQEE